jgi:hypothetical protein
MENQTRQILEEVQQMISQYREEVPGARHTWPASIKTRILKLNGLGLTPKEISAASGLSYFTVVNWIPKEDRRRYRTGKQKTEQEGQFAQVAIRTPPPAIATVTVAKRLKQLPAQTVSGSDLVKTATVTVTLPSGIRIDGVTPDFLSSWLRGGDRPWE